MKATAWEFSNVDLIYYSLESNKKLFTNYIELEIRIFHSLPRIIYPNCKFTEQMPQAALNKVCKTIIL